MRHEREVMPKKSSVVIFPSLSDPMRGICRNREPFSVDLLENTHVGKKCWGLVFYGINSKLLYYFTLGSKHSTASSTPNALGDIIAEHRIPKTIITDSNGVLGTGKKWKHYLGKMFAPLRTSEPDEHNQNPVKRVIQKLKSVLSN